jgi:hypothetical protein
LWFEKVFRRGCKGAAFLHRYADDFVCGFGRAEEAERFYNELEERLRKFGLELAKDKTQVIPSVVIVRETEWCRQNRHRRVREQVQLLNAKLRGWNNYYGVNGNRASLDEFFYHVRRIHQRWLNQRSQRHSYTWAAYTELLRLLALEHPRIVPRG